MKMPTEKDVVGSRPSSDESKPTAPARELDVDPESTVHCARLYNLAAKAFDRPDETLTEAVISGEFAANLVESAEVVATAGADDTLVEHAEAVAAETPADEAGVDALTTAYSECFGFEHGGQVSQYQVEYSPGTLLTSTDVLADIAGFYGAFGLEKIDGERDRPDHLCLELEFVSHLGLRSAYLALDGDDEGVEVVANARADFLEDHLGRWIPRFRETVSADVDVDFYRQLSALLDELVALDADDLGAEPTVFPEEPPAPMEQFEDDGDGDFRCNACGVTNADSDDPPML